ncbi:PREDICTED: lipase maturation factor 2-like [Ceratosolen solmsi marchali]|uniref:Lipase maturation factor n=1 Tax=Ceratosolen solmsi marchali TaxID=326594 RepID=A0AAJ6YMX5_9HYME|nr:PREDICTED: lipase maturation factor 2-like [Ceratosolen solmsi marchali]
MVSVRYTRNLFLRGMCIIYLFAFLSFYIQIPGLYGDNGILPGKTQLDLKAQISLLQKFKQKPTLLWFAPYLGLNVEYMLDVLTLIGIIISFLGFISQKFCSAPIFSILWSLYYSIYQIGQTFMWFQWDNLLLEAGFLCIIVAPFWYSNHIKKSTPSDSLTFWTVRWLFFRLIFSNGVIKLTSDCPLWWKLDALSVYFESQCIPTPLAWYAHHLPSWYLRLNTVGANILELVIPFLFFFPIKKVRVIAFYLQLILQIHIITTGNYNFFNLLTICLSISLLDDHFFYRKKSKAEKSRIFYYLSTIICIVLYTGIFYSTYVYYNLKFTKDWSISSQIGFTKEQFNNILSRFIPISVYVALISLSFTVANGVTNSVMNVKGVKRKITTTLITLLYSTIVAFIFAVSVVPYTVSLYPKLNMTLPVQLKEIHSKINHLQLTNSYGIFRKITGVNGRPEIIIEGSNNIEGPWKEYHFLYKPGNINNSLPFVAPYQPRLDWQMWFAALGNYSQNPWLMSFAYRLLYGQSEVLNLMNNLENPFRDNPPKYIRASLYHYHFTPSNKKGNVQSWWIRERINDYFPIFSRDHPPLVEYLSKKKIIQNKPYIKVMNNTLKIVFDFIRSLVSKVEATLLLWGMFTAGCAIIMTG